MHWKTAHDQIENDARVMSISARAAKYCEGSTAQHLTELYNKAVANPNTRQYMRHLYVTVHPVKNDAYFFQVNCNGCRSCTPPLKIDDYYNPYERLESLKVLNELFNPYK